MLGEKIEGATKEKYKPVPKNYSYRGGSVAIYLKYKHSLLYLATQDPKGTDS